MRKSLLDENKINEMLAAFFWSGTRGVVPDDGGMPRFPAIWYVMDEDNDGVPLAHGATPLEAITNWYEEKA